MIIFKHGKISLSISSCTNSNLSFYFAFHSTMSRILKGDSKNRNLRVQKLCITTSTMQKKCKNFEQDQIGVPR